MVEPAVCKSCSAPITPGDDFCPRCGVVLATTEAATGQSAIEAASWPFEEAGAPSGPDDPRVHVPEGRPVDIEGAQRSTARDTAARAAAAAREAVSQAAAEKAAAVNAAPDEEAETDPEAASGPAPEPAAQDAGKISDRILTPSASYRTLGSIGAGRPAGAVAAWTPVQVATPASGPTPALAPAPDTRPVASRSGATVAGAMPPASPTVPLTTSERVKATLASIAAEPKAELAATGLTALGGAFALVSFALPWAGDNGLGVGTVDIHPRPGAWAFDTAAGWPLFLIAAVLLAAILASDKLEELMPALAPTIRRLTESAVPMLLGGILLGVGLLYLTLPWGCGGGITLLTLGAILLIAGSIVGLFFPAAARRT